MNATSVLAAALAAALALWGIDHYRQGLQAAEARAATAEGQRDEATAKAVGFADLAGRLDALQGQLTGIEAQSRATQTTLAAQGVQLRQSLLELKRNDPEVRAWLDAPVPAALGLRYARTTSYDPTTWRLGAAASVRPDAVPSAGPSGTSQ